MKLFDFVDNVAFLSSWNPGFLPKAKNFPRRLSCTSLYCFLFLVMAMKETSQNLFVRRKLWSSNLLCSTTHQPNASIPFLCFSSTTCHVILISQCTLNNWILTSTLNKSEREMDKIWVKFRKRRTGDYFHLTNAIIGLVRWKSLVGLVSEGSTRVHEAG